jgi:hypothetical protein
MQRSTQSLAETERSFLHEFLNRDNVMDDYVGLYNPLHRLPISNTEILLSEDDLSNHTNSVILRPPYRPNYHRDHERCFSNLINDRRIQKMGPSNEKESCNITVEEDLPNLCAENTNPVQFSKQKAAKGNLRDKIDCMSGQERIRKFNEPLCVTPGEKRKEDIPKSSEISEPDMNGHENKRKFDEPFCLTPTSSIDIAQQYMSRATENTRYNLWIDKMRYMLLGTDRLEDRDYVLLGRDEELTEFSIYTDPNQTPTGLSEHVAYFHFQIL